MRLVVGLGNPGEKYYNNKHNVGFLLLDQYAENKGFKFKKKLKYFFAILDEIIFIKPRTYMNRSGAAVTSIITKYHIDDILVIVDDINLPLGEIRLRREGGSGGHNGIASIVDALGTDKFQRFRIGVGIAVYEGLSDYVLSDFSKDEKEILHKVFGFSENLLEKYVKFDFDHMVDQYSKLKISYSEKITNSQDQ
ncbi:MAG: aminoacyl-tRNA hydrolase [Candidatus Cloacimonetes bacterium]|jgi:PTH1 family peptidyl-tRNA hydrolase|nr:aminoacyl-tRNA hydrolase [Candidatus Cloacimonadota bacterium]